MKLNILIGAIAWLAILPLSAAERPQFTIDTSAVYDPAAVPAYAIDHADIYAHIIPASPSRGRGQGRHDSQRIELPAASAESGSQGMAT